MPAARPVGQSQVLSSEEVDVVAQAELGALAAARIRDILTRQGDAPPTVRDTALVAALRQVEFSVSKREPKIFLSYPEPAQPHAMMLKVALRGLFDVDDYQQPDLERIIEQVTKKIAAADFFIGIWHHEAIGEKFTVSPWLPLEYGIAVAAGKQCALVHSDRLPKRIWKRIEAGIARPAFNDLTFASKTVPLLAEYCRTHWLA